MSHTTTDVLVEETAIDYLPLHIKALLFYGLKALTSDIERNLWADTINPTFLTDEQRAFYNQVVAKCRTIAANLQATTPPQELSLLKHFSK